MSSKAILSRKLEIVTQKELASSDEIIYVDHSILSTFKLCNEKGRLAYVEHWQSNKPVLALDFGSCFHAGVQAFYEAKAKPGEPLTFDDCTKQAEIGFIKEWQARGGHLPVELDNADDEKRSLERGIWLVKAYIARWKNESYVNMINQTNGKPFTEIGFAVFLMDWRRPDGKLIPVMYVGRWDRIMQSRIDGRPWIFEVKTTSMGLEYYIKQVKPNHQLTGYYNAAIELFDLDIAGIVWDCIFVSTRKPDTKTNDHWRQVGIDFEKDFARQETRRSQVDRQEWLYDTQLATIEFLSLQERFIDRRWHRNAPTACHMYGGCQFKDVCPSTAGEQVLNTLFHKQVWEPWKGITE